MADEDPPKMEDSDLVILSERPRLGMLVIDVNGKTFDFAINRECAEQLWVQLDLFLTAKSKRSIPLLTLEELNAMAEAPPIEEQN